MSSTKKTASVRSERGPRFTHTRRPGVANALSRMSDSADCVLNFAEFLKEAKPEEIRLLAEILSEWRNWSGSLRRGNFFRGVAEAVLAGEPGLDLSRWPAHRGEPRPAKTE